MYTYGKRINKYILIVIFMFPIIYKSADISCTVYGLSSSKRFFKLFGFPIFSIWAYM